MKTKLLCVACIVLVAALFSAYQATAQEPPVPPAVMVDLGEVDLLKLACAYSANKAAKEGLAVKWCRRAAPDALDGYQAKVYAQIKIGGYGVFNIETSFQKSLWWVADWAVTPR